MTYNEFLSLKKGDTVEEKGSGVLGEVTGKDIDCELVWVQWEDAKPFNSQWSYIKDINKY
ncbi:hypothetical protein P4K49_30820 [Bacillus cereus]|uniref:Uncharacterized protein n=1 Tax=Bacillus thuringiensis TaxID=1428 RepID=A0A9X6VF32_BACTU|nr:MULTISPECIES: hypothetical protein [Bacillus cereus group]MCU5278236.1 hypothetical protein [Bacillus cereus]AMR85226.1 hypothetical protein A3L20_14755 [Bacillus thuringiensis]MBG9637694.1 hypothetical protein [Bacillus thuringiensis]MBG9637839.1 hypothetical protein [Bacillus thuringiensis]MBG9674919.1 hypothetical protein [Bacillus thuringiensis]